MSDAEETTENPQPERTIGQLLREARAAKGLSLEEIANQSKIKASALGFLENDEFAKLPNLLTAKGFMRVYAGILNLDAEALTQKFNRQFPEENACRTGREIKVGMTVDRRTLFPNGMKTMNSPGLSHFRTAGKNKKSGRLLSRLAAGFIAVALILAAIIYVINHSLGDIKNTNLRQQSDVEKLSAKDTPESKQRAMDPRKVYINAQALNKTYVSVVIDGRTIFNGNLERGAVKSWEGNQYIRIRAAAPRNLYLFLNGEDAGVMSEQLTEMEKTYYTPSSAEETPPKPTIPAAVPAKSAALGSAATENIGSGVSSILNNI
ncbi:MAG: DUF4115 domain-containing protein [Candidatus Margulisbacteria bacterium]|jgi:transcriptional regulator with XRE-family HTH domain|nr:DUF4115 domain-containing protein [Candidatus Margulisiibacteriota bacterium]